MKAIEKDQIEKLKLPGRIIQQAVGKDAIVKSNKMTMGFARYSKESGPMAPHHHAEEIIFIIKSKRGKVRCGNSETSLSKELKLKDGMILHFPELEWHVFEYDDDGFIEVLFFYGQVDKIRPEEIDN
jgi:mannose-6-phosphate isomerase-like protein (cupin superfamily)